MTILEMNERKRELGYSYQKIAELSGLPVGTVQKVLGGITRSPRRKTILALEKVLNVQDADLSTAAALSSGKYPNSVQENVLAYQVKSGKQQGEYTLEDYYALPDEERVELIDGVIYDMNAPLNTHQMIVGYLHHLLFDIVKQKKASCLPFISPVNVRLDNDDRTMVQPDIVLLCDRSKFKKNYLAGAPDFLVEVLSPSTKKKDMYLKLQKYENAGVKEYWIVDPDQRRIIVHRFGQENDLAIYTFRDTIPIGISDDTASVDFSEIDDYVRPFLDME